MTCLKHCQTYEIGEYCVYCGTPAIFSSSSTTSTNMHRFRGYDKSKLEWNEFWDILEDPSYTPLYMRKKLKPKQPGSGKQQS